MASKKQTRAAHDGRAVEAMNRLKSSTDVCLDTETSGLDWKRNHIVGWVLTFGPKEEDSYYLPVRHAGGGNIGNHAGPQDKEGWKGRLHPVEKELVAELERKRLLFGHNMAFDLLFMIRCGFGFGPRIEDTIINAPLLDEHLGKYSLEFLAHHAGVAHKKGKAMVEYLRKKFPEATERDAMGHYWRLAGDDPMAVEYAEGDGTSTWQLRDWQMPQIAAQQLEEVHDVESRLIPVLARMSAMGIRIDEERLHELDTFVRGNIETLMNQFPSGFNPKSPGDVQKWCEAHGNTDWPTTAKRGMPSFPEQWLATHEAGRKIVEVRKQQTLLNTFLTPMLETHLFKGRVHTSYNQLRGESFGTTTGRLSTSHPNLQAVPKRDKVVGKLYRSIFVPDREIWASVDYVQCEPVLLAYYSRCKVLLDGYRADPPIDAHQSVANATGLDRDLGKRINQTLITGGGKGVVVEKYGVDPKEIDRIWNEYFARMPEIRVLQKRASRLMQSRGYVLSLLGRRARLKDYNKSYVAMNRLLQCGNADIIKSKMVEIDDYLASEGRPMELLHNIHDDLSYQFDEADRKHYQECLQIMQDFGSGSRIELDVPLRADPGEGRNWAIATYGDDDAGGHGDKPTEGRDSGGEKPKRVRSKAVAPAASRRSRPVRSAAR